MAFLSNWEKTILYLKMVVTFWKYDFMSILWLWAWNCARNKETSLFVWKHSCLKLKTVNCSIKPCPLSHNILSKRLNFLFSVIPQNSFMNNAQDKGYNVMSIFFLYFFVRTSNFSVFIKKCDNIFKWIFNLSPGLEQ